MKKYLAIVLLLASVALGVNKRHIRPQVATGPDTVLFYKLWAPTTATLAHDYSGNSNDGTATGTSIIPAYPGYDLAGNDEYFDVGASLQATLRASFTVTMWVRLDDGVPGAAETLISTFDQTGADSRFSISVGAFTGILAFVFESEGNSGTNAATAATPFVNNQAPWTFIAATLDATLEGAGGKLLYVNGSVATLGISDGDTTGVTSASFTVGTNVFIGALNTDGTDSGNVAGQIGEVMIFNVAKSAAEIKSIYETQRHRYGI